MTEDWFFTGEDAEKKNKIEAKRKKAEEKDRAEKRKNNIWRFYLPVGVETQITFVDGMKHPDGYVLPFAFDEHNFNLHGSWKNWLTCIKNIRGKDGNKLECPACLSGLIPYLANAYTIIDHSEWTDKKDNFHKDELKLFIAKYKTQIQLDKFIAKHGTLRGLRFDVSRTDSQKASVGDTFVLDEKVELKDDIVPVPYTEIFKPKSPEEIRDILGLYDEEESEESIRF